jgi:hypothetical protein
LIAGEVVIGIDGWFGAGEMGTNNGIYGHGWAFD